MGNTKASETRIKQKIFRPISFVWIKKHSKMCEWVILALREICSYLIIKPFLKICCNSSFCLEIFKRIIKILYNLTFKIHLNDSNFQDIVPGSIRDPFIYNLKGYLDHKQFDYRFFFSKLCFTLFAAVFRKQNIFCSIQ